MSTWFESAYSRRYHPPAPVLSLGIAPPGESSWLTIDEALVDTGADTSLLPEDLLRRLDVIPWDTAYLRSAWGELRTVYRYEVDVRIGDKVFPGIHVVSDAQSEEVVLGRDLLNRFRFLCDGPNRRIQLLD